MSSYVLSCSKFRASRNNVVDGLNLPKGLNEQAADVELDMFACGMA